MWNAILTEVKSDDGLTGYGIIHAGPAPRVCDYVAKLGAFVAGMDALATTAVWERLFALTNPRPDAIEGRADISAPISRADRTVAMAAIAASGVEPLDRYLQRQAGQDARRRVASCFVLVSDGDHVPIGYYTLAATSIALAKLPEPPANRLPRYPVVPATLMRRLAVDARRRQQGYGDFMLFDAFSRVLRNDTAT